MTRERTESAQEATFRILSDLPALLGESPVYSPVDDAVWWIDIEGCRLIRTCLDGNSTAWPTPEMPGFVQIGRDARPILGMESGLFSFDAESDAFVAIRENPQPGTRFNDSCVGTDGTLWAGTMDLSNNRPIGVLYRVREDMPLDPVLEGFKTINGLAIDPTRGRLYVSDSHPSVQTVWLFDLADKRRRPTNRRVFARFDDLPGRPDGAMVDRDGGYWIAGIGGGELCRFSPEGRLSARITLPFGSPTKPAFAGSGGNRVVLTSRADATHGGHLAWCAADALGCHSGPQNFCAIGTPPTQGGATG